MGAGNPTWYAQQTPARSSALVIRALHACRAEWVGKTVTDELAFGLTGINEHYGTPINPADNRRFPGGSSSGSAVAVAFGDVDFAIGTDAAPR
jgi:amidase